MFYGVLLVVFLGGCLFGCSDEKVSKDVSSIKSRLEKIENRLANIEKSAKRAVLLEVELRKLQQSMEAWERAITARLKAGAVNKKTNPANRASGREKNKKGKTKDYTVKRGDSLYRIAQEHGMSVEQLCQLNKMTSKTVLQTGSKMRVYSGDNR